MENSLLELWSEDNYGEKTDEILETLTVQDIINAVNTESYSKVLGFDQDFHKYLGGVTKKLLKLLSPSSCKLIY